jgi:hypothetical protein
MLKSSSNVEYAIISKTNRRRVMCGFYADNQKIKKGDRALYDGDEVLILEANHIKSNKTMDIIYQSSSNEKSVLNFPYKTVTSMQLLQRTDK